MQFKVEDFEGLHEVSDITAFEQMLMKRDPGGCNSFWMSHGDHRHPSMALLVNNGLVSLHYFPKESHAGFVPTGNMAGLKRGGTTTFHLDKSGEEVYILNDAVVPFSVGIELAKEFFVSESLPAEIKWNEL